MLAGGDARRLAGEKAGRELGGRTLLEHVCDAALAACDEVLLLAGARAVRAPAGVRPVADRADAPGPLGALAAGLAEASHPWAVLLACDMPFVGSATIGRLLDHASRLEPDTRVLTVTDGDRVHPFPGVYTRSLAPDVEELLTAGARSLHALLEVVAAARVAEADVDPDGRCLWNLNTPADLERARRAFRTRTPT